MIKQPTNLPEILNRPPFMILRLATRSDENAIWEIFRAVVAPGDTYVFDPQISRSDAVAYWFHPNTRTYVAESDV